METQTGSIVGDVRNRQLLWLAGAVGATAGIAVWAYNRRRPTYWERTKRTVARVADNAADINPWLAVGAGTAALGGAAAVAYRRRAPKSMWQRSMERGGELVSQAEEQLRPWLATIASVAISMGAAAYNAKSRQRAGTVVADRAESAANKFAELGSRIRRHLSTISGEAKKAYPSVRKLIA